MKCISQFSKMHGWEKPPDAPLGLELFQDIIYYSLYNILYHFDEKAYFSKVYKVNLTKKLFSTQKNELLFYFADIDRIGFTTRNNVSVLNQELNILSRKIQDKGGKLIVLPCPDKYEVYCKYIANNILPKNNFFEFMDELQKEFVYIDTRKLLLEQIDNGKKDIYFADDTHWSPISAKLVANEIFKELSILPASR
ncbi:MAG: hypothetical protein HQM09_19480 [Candidatus Riflebacteria bacterium]|nr:hypothetical protein [Candidatus Riflebacteria bacterium]